MAIALALAVALCYGGADFCGGLAARRVSTLAVVVWSQATGLVVLLAVLPAVPGAPHASDLGLGLLCGLFGTFAVGLLYRGLAVGVMGVVSPITAVLAATLPVGWGIARGERPPGLALIGIGCALAAVVLVSAVGPQADSAAAAPPGRGERKRRIPPGIPEALGAGLAFGFLFIALAQARTGAGLYPLLTMRVLSLLLLVGGAFALRRPLAVVRPGRATVALCGALDMAANVLYVLAVHAGALSIVAVLSSLYPAATVALAAFVLRERLVRVQWAGVAVAFAGVLCISLAR